MIKSKKKEVIDSLVELLNEAKNFYIVDIAGLNAKTTLDLRRKCFNSDVVLSVFKNTLINKAMELSSKDFENLNEVLVGNSALMICDIANTPAKMIKEFNKKHEKPIIKGAYVEETVFVGDNLIETLASIKSKEEVIADVIALLQSPPKNVVSALQSGGNKLSGILKTLAEK